MSSLTLLFDNSVSGKVSDPSEKIPWPVCFLLCYLAAITIIGKGPTYLGYPPFFWGEIVLGSCLVWLAWSPATGSIWRGAPCLSVLITLFIGLGAILTAFSFPRWGLDAVRDGAMWYYAAFYFIGLNVAAKEGVAERVWRFLTAFWMLALLWGIADTASGSRLSEMGPVIPWRGWSVLANSHHELRQNVALGSVLVLCTDVLKSRPLLRALLLPAGIGGLFVLATADGRGVRVGFVCGIIAVLLLGFAPHATNMSVRMLVLIVSAATALSLLVLIADTDISRIARVDRFTQANPFAPEGTAHWRQLWWRNLIDKMWARNPLFGLGFGENLSVYNPMLTIQETNKPLAVRSPHNFNMSVLTRMGLAGFTLWALIVITGIGRLFLRVWKGKAGRNVYSAERWEELSFWVMMLICTWLNSSFGVLMEGPVLGVWFWFALGFATRRAEPDARDHFEALERETIPGFQPTIAHSPVGIDSHGFSVTP
jgi:hypothetical protein